MNELLRKWQKEILYGLGILILATFLRLYNLTTLPVFGDEAIYIRWAQVMRAEPSLRFLPLSDGKQPLFMWVVIPFFKIFSDPLFASRFVSALVGIGTLIGIFILSYNLFKNIKLSLFASLICAISPYSIFFDRLALADSMLSMFGIWSFIFALIAAKKLRADYAMLSGFSLGGALLTKSPGIFFVGLIPLSWLLNKWSTKFKEKVNTFSVLVLLFSLTYSIAFGLYNILRLGVNFHMISIRNKDYVYPVSHLFTRPLDPLIPFLKQIIEYFWLLGPSFLILLVVIGFYYGLKNKKKETLLLTAWGILPILMVAEFSKTITARYIYFSLPYLFILAGFSIAAAKKNLGVNLIHLKGGLALHLRKLIILLLITFIIHALFVDYQLLTKTEKVDLPRSERSGYLEGWTSGYGIREAADFIREEYKKEPNKKIVVGTEGYFGTLPDGLQIYLNDLSEITVIGVGIDLKEIPVQLVESKDAGNKTFFVINASRLMTDYQKLDLNLIAAYPKAVKPDGSRDVLYLFELD